MGTDPDQAKPSKSYPRVALVVGNSNYPDPLRNPVNDARAITSQLLDAGFHVVGGVGEGRSSGQDVTAHRLHGLTTEFLAALRKGTVAVIYYAGHGVQIGERNYLVPVDAQLDGSDPLPSLFPLASIVERACERAGKSGRVVVLLDACRNNPFRAEQIDGMTRALASETEVRGTAVAQGARGLAKVRLTKPERAAPQFIAFATAPGEVAYDGGEEDTNSPFAAALARHIPTRGLAMSALIERVGLDVEAKVADLGLVQDPWCTTNLKEPMYIRPRTWLPLFETMLLGALAGAAICWLMFGGGSFVNPYAPDQVWAWSLGLLFALPLGFQTVRWGDRMRPPLIVFRDAFFATAGSALAFGLGLVALRLIVHAQAVSLAPRGLTEAPIASMAFTMLGSAAGVLLLAGTITSWKPQRRTLNGAVTSLIMLLAPFALTACLISFGTLMLNPERSTAVLLALLAGILFAAGSAISCAPMGGLFRSFGPLTGAIMVGLTVALLFLVFDTLRLGGPDHLLAAGLGLGVAWFAMLGAQLGYCLVYYVPDHRRLVARA